MSSQIEVTVRIRPHAEPTPPFVVSDNSITFKTTPQHQFSFDQIFPPSLRNEDVYKTTAKSIIDKAMHGVNGSIFAYGQTGSGKTHTMYGIPEDEGIIMLGVKDVFSFISSHPKKEFLLRVSYLEIYNEQIHDLLADGPKRDLKLHENRNVCLPSNHVSVNSLLAT
jgi:centromeric protein E